MRTLLGNDNNDFYLVNNDLAMGTDKQATAQIVKNVLQTQLGELSTDTTRGIPYLETVLGDNPDVNLWSSYMVKAINDVEYVNRVVSFVPQVNHQENKLSFMARISTIYGEYNINDDTI